MSMNYLRQFQYQEQSREKYYKTKQQNEDKEIQDIQSMNISLKTHNMMIIDNKAKEFIIQPFDEKLQKDEFKNKQKVNQNLIIVQDKEITVPEFEQIQRICQIHKKTIDRICTHNECKQKNEILLCQNCARNHKGHTLYDISEVLFLIQKNQQSLEKDKHFIEVLKCKTFSEIKIVKSNIMAQLDEIENKLNEGFIMFKQKLSQKKCQYEQAFKDIQFGGLSEMLKQVNNIYDQGVFQEGQSNSKDLIYNQLAQQLELTKEKMKKFEQLLQQVPQDQVKIKINDEEFLIQNQKIQNLNDLYFQIKIDALKQNRINIIYQELLLFSQNKAIKLKGNPQEINLKQQKGIQVISYSEI